MLKDVRLKGFTVFNDTTISFAKGMSAPIFCMFSTEFLV